jgi:hypothetical protein
LSETKSLLYHTNPIRQYIVKDSWLSDSYRLRRRLPEEKYQFLFDGAQMMKFTFKQFSSQTPREIIENTLRKLSSHITSTTKLMEHKENSNKEGNQDCRKNDNDNYNDNDNNNNNDNGNNNNNFVDIHESSTKLQSSSKWNILSENNTTPQSLTPHKRKSLHTLPINTESFEFKKSRIGKKIECEMKSIITHEFDNNNITSRGSQPFDFRVSSVSSVTRSHSTTLNALRSHSLHFAQQQQQQQQQQTSKVLPSSFRSLMKTPTGTLSLSYHIYSIKQIILMFFYCKPHISYFCTFCSPFQK